MSQNLIAPLLLDATRQFFERIYGQFPHLFADGDFEFRDAILTRLVPAPAHLTQANYLDIQRAIFKRMEAVNQPDWYPIFHCVYVQTIRRSHYGRQLFAALFAEAQSLIGQAQFDRVLVPGCGKFYEADDVCRLTRAKSVVALDVDFKDIELSRAVYPDLTSVHWRYHDLTAPLQDEPFDLVLFLHPQVCDYDKLWESPVYKRYGEEFRVPISELSRSATHKFIPAHWVKILDNAFAALKPGGSAVFLCYEHRERAIIQSYLANKKHLEELISDDNDLIVDPAFSHDMLACLDTELAESARFVAMGAYRSLLVVRKSLS